ncbi:hypothetical protein T4B_2816 [Trichinella pseudospiralis]|uniref:histone acetyltransferase n=1 Tax=Trichinella pseudospiralis TaxID=6337 RepID=A0A0V1GPB2_TRIPS|nr:hypothetical protein T4B_2816 [Trichinella pseudospiralis]
MCFHYCTSIPTSGISTEARYADKIEFIVHHSEVPYVGRLWGPFDRIEKEHRTCTPERPFSVERLAAYQRYWLQSIVEYMAQKGTKWQFDIIELLKLSGISDVGIAAKLFTYDMLANVHEEYWIVISEV